MEWVHVTIGTCAMPSRLSVTETTRCGHLPHYRLASAARTNHACLIDRCAVFRALIEHTSAVRSSSNPKGGKVVTQIHGCFASVSRLIRANSRLFREFRTLCFAKFAPVSRCFAAQSRCVLQLRPFGWKSASYMVKMVCWCPQSLKLAESGDK